MDLDDERSHFVVTLPSYKVVDEEVVVSGLAGLRVCLGVP